MHYPRPEPTSEEFLALVILLGPLAYVVRWIWRWVKERTEPADHPKNRQRSQRVQVSPPV